MIARAIDSLCLRSAGRCDAASCTTRSSCPGLVAAFSPPSPPLPLTEPSRVDLAASSSTPVPDAGACLPSEARPSDRLFHGVRRVSPLREIAQVRWASPCGRIFQLPPDPTLSGCILEAVRKLRVRRQSSTSIPHARLGQIGLRLGCMPFDIHPPILGPPCTKVQHMAERGQCLDALDAAVSGAPMPPPMRGLSQARIWPGVLGAAARRSTPRTPQA